MPEEESNADRKGSNSAKYWIDLKRYKQANYHQPAFFWDIHSFEYCYTCMLCILKPPYLSLLSLCILKRLVDKEAKYCIYLYSFNLSFKWYSKTSLSSIIPLSSPLPAPSPSRWSPTLSICPCVNNLLYSLSSKSSSLRTRSDLVM